MAWGRKPEEPKPAAGDPEVKPGEKKEDDKDVATIIAEALKPFGEQFSAMRAELDSLKAPKPAAPGAPEIPSVLDDENGAFNARLTPVLAKVYESEAKMVANDVEREYRSAGYGDLWDENRAEINKELEATPLVREVGGKIVAHRGDAAYIRKVADMVIGQAVRKGLLKYDGRDKKFFLEDASGDTSIIGRKPLDSDGLSKKQIEAAKRFGIPLADFKKAKDRLDFVS